MELPYFKFEIEKIKLYLLDEFPNDQKLPMIFLKDRKRKITAGKWYIVISAYINQKRGKNKGEQERKKKITRNNSHGVGVKPGIPAREASYISTAPRLYARIKNCYKMGMN